MKIRKWMIYGGVFFVALSTVAIIISTGSRFAALEPTPICEVVAGEQLPDECTGSGGGSIGETCLEYAEPVGTEGTASAISDPGDCVCYDYPPFDVAHDGVTESTQQAGVSALDGNKQKLDELWQQFINDSLNPHFERARLISAIIGGGNASQEKLNQLANAIADGITKTWADPVYNAKILAGVVDPAIDVAKIVYESSSLPKKLKHAEGDSSTEPDRKREVSILNGFKPNFDGFPNNFRIKGFNVDLLNYTISSGDFEACLKLKLEIATGTHRASAEGLKISYEIKKGSNFGFFTELNAGRKTTAAVGLTLRF